MYLKYSYFMPRILHLHIYVFNIGLVHPKGKLAHDLTHPQAILGVYDFLLSVILKKISWLF